MSAALVGFKPFKIFNIISGDISENSKFKSLKLNVSIVGCDFRFS